MRIFWCVIKMCNLGMMGGLRGRGRILQTNYELIGKGKQVKTNPCDDSGGVEKGAFQSLHGF